MAWEGLTPVEAWKLMMKVMPDSEKQQAYEILQELINNEKGPVVKTVNFLENHPIIREVTYGLVKGIREGLFSAKDLGEDVVDAEFTVNKDDGEIPVE